MRKLDTNANEHAFRALFWTFFTLISAAVVYAAVRYLIFLYAEDLSSFDALMRLLPEALPPLILLAVAAVACAIFLKTGVKRPIRELTSAVNGLSDYIEERKEMEDLPVKGCFAELSDALFEESEKLAGIFTARQKVVTAETEKRVRLAIARDVLGRAVPERTSFFALTYGVCAREQISPAVGGDFCDAFPVDKSRILLAVGDVWGRGLPAALFATRIKSEIRSNIFAGKSLSDTLFALNASLLNNREELMATVQLLLYFPETGDVRYANAGHPAPIVVGGGKSGFLRVRAGCPVGVYRDFSVEEGYYLLDPGQGLLLYSEGAAYARGAEGAYGFDRLLFNAGKEFENAIDADRFADGVLNSVNAFCGGTSGDDIALVALLYPNGIQRIFRPQLDELQTMRSLLSEWLINDPRRKKIIQICEEIFSNIVAHAGAQSIQMNCRKEDGKLLLRFTDDGEPFDPLAEKGDPYDLGSGDAGTSILRQIGGEMFYRTKENVNVLTLRLSVIQEL